MINYEYLCAQARHPDAAYRPVQIIHGYFPHDVEKFPAFLADAREKGMGGFVVNVGAAGYLQNDAEWEILRKFVEYLLDNGMKVWLYDEDGYPSGAAGRLVIDADPEYAVRGLCAQTIRTAGGQGSEPVYGSLAEHNDGRGEETPRVISAAAYPILGEKPEIRLDRANALPVELDGGEIRWDLPAGDYLIVAIVARKTNYQTEHKVFYVDLLNPAVTEEFLNVTHRQYLARFGAETLSRIEAIFTDEPGLSVHGCSGHFAEKFAVVPWTDGLDEVFAAKTGLDFAEMAIHIFFDTENGGADREIRRAFWKMISDRYTDSFFAPIYDFCQQAGIEATGHLYGEENLAMQIGLNGTMFAHMIKMQMPGVDRLYCTNPVNVIPEKTASSAAHFAGHSRVMSESSSHFESNWWKTGYTVEDMINSSLYQAQLGINQTASYYGYGQDAAERRRFEEVVGRASAFTTHGTHRAELAVLIPTEAAWERYLPRSYKYWDAVLTWDVEFGIPEDLARLEMSYHRTLTDILDRQMDFDLMDLAALDSCAVDHDRLLSAWESFHTLLVFDCGQPDPDTAAALTRLAEDGMDIRCIPVDGRRSAFYEAIGAEVWDSAAYAPRGFSLTEPNAAVRIRHSSVSGAEVYFLHNRTAEDTIFGLKNLPTGVEAELFDLMTGEHHPYGGEEIGLPAKSAAALVFH